MQTRLLLLLTDAYGLKMLRRFLGLEGTVLYSEG